MNRTFSLLFHVLKHKPQPNQTVPIYMRLTVDGRRAEVSTGRYVDPNKWEAKLQKATGKAEEIKSLNDYLKNT